jgi:hypothetical protein
MFRTGQSGQSMVEFAVCLPLLVLIFTGVVFFGRGFIIGQRAGMAARYASWRFAKDKSTPEADVKSTVRSIFEFDYELNNKSAGLGSGFSSGLSFITSAGGGKKTTISFSYKPNYIAYNPDAINIGHTVTVDGETWTYEELGSDNLLGVILNWMFDQIGSAGSALRDAIGGGQSGQGDQYTQPPDDNRPSEQEQ